MEEKNLTTCKKCQQNKWRVRAGQFPSGEKKFTNESGMLWSGKLCPECNTSRVKKAMKAIRKAERDKRIY